MIPHDFSDNRRRMGKVQFKSFLDDDDIKKYRKPGNLYRFNDERIRPNDLRHLLQKKENPKKGSSK